MKIPCCVPFWNEKEFLAKGGSYNEELGFHVIKDSEEAGQLWEYLPDQYKYPNQPTLIPQMLPANTWKENVRLQVPQEKWDAIRRYSYKAAGNRCEICGGKGQPYLECHEQWVFYVKVSVQYLAKFRALCTLCHKAHHLGFANRVGILSEVKEHLKQVNSWDNISLDKALKEADQLHQRLSAIPWTLDTSYIDKSGYFHVAKLNR